MVRWNVPKVHLKGEKVHKIKENKRKYWVRERAYTCEKRTDYLVYVKCARLRHDLFRGRDSSSGACFARKRQENGLKTAAGCGGAFRNFVSWGCAVVL